MNASRRCDPGDVIQRRLTEHRPPKLRSSTEALQRRNSLHRRTALSQYPDLVKLGPCSAGEAVGRPSMTVRTPWWLNLIVLGAAIGLCVAFGLPWYVAGVAALVIGTAADRLWEASGRRR